MKEDHCRTLLHQELFSKSRDTEEDRPAGPAFFPALSVKIWRPSELVTILLGRDSEPEGG
jgi:hypothetical protein